jgi:hypothetical protein
VEGFEPSATGTTNHNIGSLGAKFFDLSIPYLTLGNTRITRIYRRTTTKPLRSDWSKDQFNRVAAVPL